LSNLSDFKVPAEGVKALPNIANISVFDQWILTKLGEVMKTVDEAMEFERFSEAANALYHFIWNEFCDWYIEFTKPILNGVNAEEKAATQLVIAQILNRITRLLHPFTPFISEEIYQKLPIKGQACIIDQYPTVSNDKDLLAFGSQQSAFEIDLVKEVITAIRNIRGENRISPAVKLNVRLGVNNDQVQKILGNNRNALIVMGRLENIEIGEAGNMMKCAVSTAIVKDAEVKVIIPLEGLVDFDEELKRINKTIEKLTKDISMLNAKLSNEKFVANAEEDVIAADRILLAQAKVQIETLRDALTRFQ
jgi:valyl-tRNA synthetase